MNLGDIGETEVELYFLRRGYEVYKGSKNNYFDFVIYNTKTDSLKTVEVKTTSRRSKNNKAWVVDIRRSYGNLPFEGDKVDLLAVYIEPTKEIRIFKGCEIKQLTTLTLTDNVGE